jgi:glycosyltransferase involved in cell wall biosynthesis
VKIRLEISSIASRYRSGVAQYTQLLANALVKSDELEVYGHYFDFLGRQPKPSTAISARRMSANKLIPLRVYAKAQSHKIAPPFDIHLPPVDVTIFPNFATWPSVKSGLVTTVVHDLTYIRYPEVVEKNNLPHLQRVVPRSIKKADFIITVSESVKSEIVKEFNVSPERCVVTPIPPDEAFFIKETSEKITAVREKYNIDPNKKYIYFIGNFEPRKNLKTLIEAYQLLPQNIKDEYSLVLAGGKGWKNESTERAIKTAIKNGDDVHHIGFVDQVDSPALFQGASLFVMPSLYEGFGMPVLEAMAGGTPVVASNIPVLKEVGQDLATYADPSSSKSFSNAIGAALSTPSPSRAKLQKNVRRYSWDKNIAVILEKCNQLLNRE